MKKMVSSLLMTSALLLGAVAPVVANAADTSEPNTTGKTDVKATFTSGTTTVDPVDPDNPNTPGNGGGNGATPGSGLSLIYVTNGLDFGSHEVNAVNKASYDASATPAATLWNNKFVLEVSDTRGANTGWTLNVTGSNFTGTDNTTVKGISIDLPGGTVKTSSENKDTIATATDNVASENTAIALDGTSASTVMSASDGKGAGVNTNQIDPANIKLNVPAGLVKAQAYTSALNWTLSDTPGK